MSAATASDVAGAGRPAWADRLAEQRGLLIPLAALAALVAYFGIRDSAFLAPGNLTVMASQGGPLLLIALGATFVVLMGSIDLSVGAVATLAAAVAALLIRDYEIGVWALPVAVGIGALAGLLNAICSVGLRLPSFIVTLGTLSVFTGISLHLLDGRALVLGDPEFNQLASGRLIPGVPNVLLVGIVLWALLVVVNGRTRFGRYIAAIGAGERIAALSGIPVARYKTLAFVVSGALAALGGAFLLSRLGSATPTLGDDYLLNVIAAIVVGGTALTGGVGGVARTLLGVVLITVLSNGLNVVGVSSFTQEIVTGVVVILAILTTVDRKRMQDIVK